MKKLFVVFFVALSFIALKSYAVGKQITKLSVVSVSQPCSDSDCRICCSSDKKENLLDGNMNTIYGAYMGPKPYSDFVLKLDSTQLVGRIEIYTNSGSTDCEVYFSIDDPSLSTTIKQQLFTQSYTTSTIIADFYNVIQFKYLIIRLRSSNMGVRVQEIKVFECEKATVESDNFIVRKSMILNGTLKIGTGNSYANNKLEVVGDVTANSFTFNNGVNNIIESKGPLKINSTSNYITTFGGTVESPVIKAPILITTNLTATNLTLPTLTFPASTQTLKFSNVNNVNTIESSNNLNIQATGKNVILGSNTMSVADNNIHLLNSNNCLNSLNIVYGNPAIPCRRGIQITPDPDGQFNFFINNWQANASFNFKESNSNTTMLTIQAGDGSVGIGTTPTNGYKLAVNGKICAEGVKIYSDVPQSDFVFKKEYKLRSLKEVEKFVADNQHLPEIPSADDFMKNGYGVGQMDDLLLRKVEELTLYIIQQQKDIEAQNIKIESLTKDVEKLKRK